MYDKGQVQVPKTERKCIMANTKKMTKKDYFNALLNITEVAENCTEHHTCKK